MQVHRVPHEVVTRVAAGRKISKGRIVVLADQPTVHEVFRRLHKRAVGFIRAPAGAGGAGGIGVSRASGSMCQDTIFQYPPSLAHNNATDAFFAGPATRKVAPKCWPYARDPCVGAPGVSRLAQSNLAAKSSGTS